MTEQRGGVAPSTQTQRQNVSDVLAVSITEKPGSAANSRDELLKQVKELNKTLALSEEAVSTVHHHYHHYQHHHHRHCRTAGKT